jgi:AraC-like DNA-binding protein
MDAVAGDEGRMMLQDSLPPGKDFAALPSAAGSLARLAAKRILQQGIDIAPLLEEAGLPPTLMDDPEARVSARGEMDFLNRAAEVLGDDLLGFHLARDYDPRRLGFFYYVMASSDRLGDALDREARYSMVVSECIRTRCRTNGALTVITEYVGVERHRDRQQIEFWVTCTLRKCRMFTRRQLVPLDVSFVHQRSGGCAEIERYFGVSPAFGAEQDRMSFEREVADLPLVTADPDLGELLLKYYREVLARRQEEQGSLRTRVENAMTPRLAHGTVNIQTIAKDLGMSVRTLSRRLADEGLTFSAILNELRSDLAQLYLHNHTISISQIAWLLGYNEASSLVRAVQRWTGKSPGEVRRAIRNPEEPDEPSSPPDHR